MTRRRILDISRILFGVLVLVFAVYKAKQSWAQIYPLLEEVNYGWLLLAILAQAVSFIFLPIPSYLKLKTWKPEYSFSEATRTFFLSQPAKYLPGSIWIFPARIYLINAAGFTTNSALQALFFETLALIVSSLTAGLFGFYSFPPSMAGWALPFALIIGTGFILLNIDLLFPNRLSCFLPRNWRQTAPGALPFSKGIATSLLSAGGLLGTWLFSGISLFLTFAALHTEIHLPMLLTLISAFSLSWVLGFIVIISPGGVGVREASLVFLLSNIFAGSSILIVAVFSRLIWSACELVLYFLFTLMPVKNSFVKAGIKK